jgi:hypothetical protein
MAGGLDCLTATISDIQENYTNGSWTAVSVLNSYLAQIDAHDQYLHAIIQLAPKTQLLELAQSLDEERKTSGTRGPLHGIPVLFKVILSDALALGVSIDTPFFFRTTLILTQTLVWHRQHVVALLLSARVLLRALPLLKA